jgi:hypothetical protein
LNERKTPTSASAFTERKFELEETHSDKNGNELNATNAFYNRVKKLKGNALSGTMRDKGTYFCPEYSSLHKKYGEKVSDFIFHYVGIAFEVHLGIIWAKEISNGANKYFSC